MKINILNSSLIAVFLTSAMANAQIIFERSVDDLPLGVYTRDQLKDDWNTTSGNGFAKNGKGENRVSIVGSTGKGGANDRCLKVKFPKNKHDSKDSGAQWKSDLGKNYDELYMSYYVKFGPNFGLDKIGKLPGLGGGLNFEDRDDATEWNGKLMWREGGRLQFYLKQPITSQKQFDWPHSFEADKNRWYHIEIHYKMNTPGKNNGIMEAWLDGDFISKYDDVPFRKNSNVGINHMFFSTFYGGNESHEPNVDNYAYFDDIKVSTSRIGSSSDSNNNNNNNNNNNSGGSGIEGTYYFKNRASGKYMDSEGDKNKSSIVNGKHKWADQHWKVVEVTKGIYNIIGVHGNRGCLDSQGGGQVIWSGVQSSSSKDRLWKLEKTNDGYYRFKNQFDNRGYLAKANKSNKIEYTNWNGNRAQWKLEKVSSAKELLTVTETKGINLYPNPSFGEFNITVEATASVQVYNLLGKLILEQKVDKGTTAINSGNSLLPGIYLISVEAENFSTIKKILIK